MSPLPSISVVLVRPLVQALADSQPTLAAFYRATDLSPQLLADPEARVSPAQFCVAWSEAIRLSKDPTLALRIAQATPFGAFGIVEYVCRSAPTLRQALSQWCRYLGILDDAVEVGLVEEHQSLRVLVESEAPAPPSHELCFALVVRHAREMMAGRLALVEVRFTHWMGAPEAARWSDFFGAPVRSGAASTELIFQPSVLDTPLSTADPNLLEILLPTAEERLGARPAHPPLTAQVRRALREALSHDDAQLEAVARRLSMTGRSLQRRLKDEGESFQGVRDQVRRQLADRYLSHDMSLAEISFLLGFSEPSAFFRAFKRWTGLTPLERRADLHGAGP